MTAQGLVLNSAGISAGELASMAVAGLPSPHTRRIYSARIRAFAANGGQLRRESIGAYLDQLIAEGSSASTINLTLAAIKRLAEEANARNLLSQTDWQAIRSMHRQKVRGVRAGNWLTLQGLRALVRAPDRATVQGKRDAAVIALLAGGGLRRSEAAEVVWGQYQEREGRMCLVDLIGKGRRVRTVPIPDWAKRDLDEWQVHCKSGAGHQTANVQRCDGVDNGRRLSSTAGIGAEDGSVVCPVENTPDDGSGVQLLSNVRGSEQRIRAHDGRILGGLSESGVWWVIKTYSEKLNIHIRPHDLRRTIAKLMRANGARIEQISLMLGHSSVQTTEKYLGSGQELGKGVAAVDCVQVDGD